VDRFRNRFRISSREIHRRPFLQEAMDGFLADTTIAPGHEGHFIIQSIAHVLCMFLIFLSGPRHTAGAGSEITGSSPVCYWQD
jgi:hypothetical protein